MHPIRMTETRLLAIQEQLSAREPIFHRPEHGATRADFEAMTTTDFWEVGASGAMYSKDYVFDVLEERRSNAQQEPWNARDFYCQEVATQTYLLTYTLLQGTRLTRRATLWKRLDDTWKILYHQGTVVNF